MLSNNQKAEDEAKSNEVKSEEASRSEQPIVVKNLPGHVSKSKQNNNESDEEKSEVPENKLSIDTSLEPPGEPSGSLELPLPSPASDVKSEEQAPLSNTFNFAFVTNKNLPGQAASQAVQRVSGAKLDPRLQKLVRDDAFIAEVLRRVKIIEEARKKGIPPDFSVQVASHEKNTWKKIGDFDKKTSHHWYKDQIREVQYLRDDHLDIQLRQLKNEFKLELNWMKCTDPSVQALLTKLQEDVQREIKHPNLTFDHISMSLTIKSRDDLKILETFLSMLDERLTLGKFKEEIFENIKKYLLKIQSAPSWTKTAIFETPMFAIFVPTATERIIYAKAEFHSLKSNTSHVALVQFYDGTVKLYIKKAADNKISFSSIESLEKLETVLKKISQEDPYICEIADDLLQTYKLAKDAANIKTLEIVREQHDKNKAEIMKIFGDRNLEKDYGHFLLPSFCKGHEIIEIVKSESEQKEAIELKGSSPKSKLNDFILSFSSIDDPTIARHYSFLKSIENDCLDQISLPELHVLETIIKEILDTSFVEKSAKLDCIKAIQSVISKRGGHTKFLHEWKKSGDFNKKTVDEDQTRTVQYLRDDYLSMQLREVKNEFKLELNWKKCTNSKVLARVTKLQKDIKNEIKHPNIEFNPTGVSISIGSRNDLEVLENFLEMLDFSLNLRNKIEIFENIKKYLPKIQIQSWIKTVDFEPSAIINGVPLPTERIIYGSLELHSSRLESNISDVSLVQFCDGTVKLYIKRAGDNQISFSSIKSLEQLITLLKKISQEEPSIYEITETLLQTYKLTQDEENMQDVNEVKKIREDNLDELMAIVGEFNEEDYGEDLLPSFCIGSKIIEIVESDQGPINSKKLSRSELSVFSPPSPSKQPDEGTPKNQGPKR